MTALRMQVRPDLQGSTLVLAFQGWNDAGEAASTALEFVSDAIQSVPLAEIDPEEFYDFTVRRPHVAMDRTAGGDAVRQIVWPANELRYGVIGGEAAVVVGLGEEPHLRWRTYCDCMVEVARAVGVSQVILLGSYLADVVYSRPVHVMAVTSDYADLEGMSADGSGYEGPSGIVGVLADRFEREGYDVACLWAGLPHYISESPNFRGALALVQKLTESLGFRINDEPLSAEAAIFEERISKIVADDRELADYVRQLKRRDFAQ